MFPSVTALHNQSTVSGLKGDGERRHILLLLVVHVKKAEGCPLCAAAVEDLVTHPDLSWSVCHRSDPTGFKMAANGLTATQQCVADKRISSLMHKDTQAYFVPTPSVVTKELLNHCVWRVLATLC